ncbi:hypothetical protein D3C71_1418030 [compost metagenome]
MNHPTLGRELAQTRVVQIARVVEDRLGRAVREDEGHRHHLDEVVEHRIGRVRLVDHDAELHRLVDQRLAGRAQALPFGALGIGGRIGELVVGKMHRAQQAQPGQVIEAQQRGIIDQRAGVLHADVDHALAGGLDARGIGGGQRELEGVRVRGEHLADFHQPQQPRIAIMHMRGLAAVALVGIDREEAAVERAFDHARVIHLRQRVAVVPLLDVETVAVEVGRRVQVAVQRQQAMLQRGRLGQLLRGELDRVGDQRRAHRQRYQQRQTAQRHGCLTLVEPRHAWRGVGSGPRRHAGRGAAVPGVARHDLNRARGRTPP